MKTRLSGYGYISAGIIVLTAVLACGNPAPVEAVSEEEQTQALSTFTFVQSSGGTRSWKLESDSAHYIEGDSVLLLSKVEITFYESNVPESFLSGDSGRIEIRNNRMRLWGNVEAESVEHRHLSAPSIEWEEETGLIHSDCLVILTDTLASGIRICSGVGIDLNTKLQGDVDSLFNAEYTENDDIR